MSGNTFGNIFKITTFGESHGEAVGVVVDGCPAGLKISEKDIQNELDKRKPGKNELVSPRKEEDKVKVLSGIFKGKTLGTPIAMIVFNEDVRSKDYEKLKNKYRPGHGDYTYFAKYGLRDFRGGGRASARETVGRVLGGAVAKKLLKHFGVKIGSSLKVFEDVEKVKKEGDSIGGIVEIKARGVGAGLGEPVFDKLSADLAKALLSIPAVKAFEIGDGFKLAKMRGSENKHIGGIDGGISNGEDIIVRICFKPTASIAKSPLKIKGRHDPCVCLRGRYVAEAMVALVLADHYLLSKVSKL